MRPLSLDKIDEIRRLRSLGHTYKQVALRVGCSEWSAQRHADEVQLKEPDVEVKEPPPWPDVTGRPGWFEEDIGRMLVGGR